MMLHLPQLFNALQSQTGCMFRTDKTYEFGSQAFPHPFEVSDLDGIFASSKFRVSCGGVFKQVDTLAEHFFAATMYTDAVNAFKLRLSMQNIVARSLSTPNPHLNHEILLTTYSLALCNYFLGKYEVAGSILRSGLEDCPRSQPIYGRLVTLLMCVDFKAGRLSDAMGHYEVAKAVLTLSLGARHPTLCMLAVTLADLYFYNGSYPQAKVMTLTALVFTQKILGEDHLLYASLSYKLGAIYLRQLLYVDAEESFDMSLRLYSGVAEAGPNLDLEISLCLHGLAMASSGLDRIDDATQLAIRSLAISVKDDNYISPLSADCLMLLAELHEKSNIPHEAVHLYGDVWNIVFTYPFDYDLPSMIIILAARMMSAYLNSQPLPIRMMYDSVAADMTEVKQREWDVGNSYVTQKILKRTPAAYIADLTQLLIESTSPGCHSNEPRNDDNFNF
jgi:tetratricopeptide (TPR) repeat protein